MTSPQCFNEVLQVDESFLIIESFLIFYINNIIDKQVNSINVRVWKV